MAKITYTNKETLNSQPSIADKNKVKADDMNEIKSVVNENDDNYIALNNKVNDINMISIYLSQNTDVSNNGKIPFDTSTFIGTKLTLNNNGIKIGSGVSKIKVSLNLAVRYTGTTNKVYGAALQINGSDPSDVSQMLEARCQKTISEPISACSGEKIMTVSENDVLTVKVIAGATCPCSPASFLTVEVIE